MKIMSGSDLIEHQISKYWIERMIFFSVSIPYYGVLAIFFSTFFLFSLFFMPFIIEHQDGIEYRMEQIFRISSVSSCSPFDFHLPSLRAGLRPDSAYGSLQIMNERN